MRPNFRQDGQSKSSHRSAWTPIDLPKFFVDFVAIERPADGLRLY